MNPLRAQVGAGQHPGRRLCRTDLILERVDHPCLMSAHPPVNGEEPKSLELRLNWRRVCLPRQDSHHHFRHKDQYEQVKKPPHERSPSSTGAALQVIAQYRDALGPKQEDRNTAQS